MAGAEPGNVNNSPAPHLGALEPQGPWSAAQSPSHRGSVWEDQPPSGSSSASSPCTAGWREVTTRSCGKAVHSAYTKESLPIPLTRFPRKPSLQTKEPAASALMNEAGAPNRKATNRLSVGGASGTDRGQQAVRTPDPLTSFCIPSVSALS